VSEKNPLIADPKRAEFKDGTGIYIRAKRGDTWDAIDIGELTTESLLRFLRSREGGNVWAESTCALILQHSHQEIDAAYDQLEKEHGFMLTPVQVKNEKA
jgi:hypothetical protein